MRCKKTLLIFSFVVLGVLVFSASSIAVLSSSPSARTVGQFSDTLPIADGQITVVEKGYCDYVQLSMDIYGVLFEDDFDEIPDLFHERTVTVDLYTARNDTPNGFIYFGVVFSEVPYLAYMDLNATWDLQGLANLTGITLRFDNNANGFIDGYEDMKVVMQGNSTFILGWDQYWNTTENEYRSDVEDVPPDPGNITAFNMTHTDTSAQGNMGNLTMEMIMPLNSGDPLDGSALLNPSTDISIDYAAWVNMRDFDWMEDLGKYRTTQFYGSTSDTYMMTDNATNFDPLTPNGLGSTSLEPNFNIDGTIMNSEKSICNFVLFSDVFVYRAGYMATLAVDVYAANNDTMLYMGIIIPDVPYWADVDLNSTWDQQAPGNLTGITVQFDNDNNGTVDDLEDMKFVMIGNSTLKVGWDQYYDASDGYYDSDIETHDAPPAPGDLVAYGITNSNSAAQSNIGDLSTEMMMPLADDVNGTDGGGLSDTVGFSVGYLGLHKSYIEAPPGEEGDQGCGLIGSIADLRTHPLLLDDDGDGYDGNGEPINASTFEELEILDITNPVIDSPLDITYEVGETGNDITWHPSDAHPFEFNITQNGTLVDSGDWDGGVITINVDGLTVGTYIFVCSVNDTAGNSVSDSVTVTVISEEEPPEVSEFLTTTLGFIALTLSLLVVAYILYKRSSNRGMKLYRLT